MEHAKAIGESFMVILTSIILVAILAVLVSNGSQTANVIQAFASAFSQILAVVVSPSAASATGAGSGAATTPSGVAAQNTAFDAQAGNLTGGVTGVSSLPFFARQ